jgi:hypothetical protein
MKLNKYILIFSLLFVSSACVKEPNKPDTPNLKSGQYVVLCEGLWGHNNSSISIIDMESQQIQNQFFEANNPDLKIGDTANDIVFKSDTAFVTVTASGSIESFSINTGKWINRLYREGSTPSKTVIINDTVAYATDDRNDSLLLKYNPKTMELVAMVPIKGKNPVGIATDGKRLFVANSGYGRYAQNEPYAGTLSVIDLETDEQTDVIEVGPNLVEVIATNMKLYLCYYNIYSKDALGGIVELNLGTLEETNRIEGFFMSMSYSEKHNRMYFIDGFPREPDLIEVPGISYIDLDKKDWEITQVIENVKPNETWYTLAVDDKTDRLLIGNAMNHSVDGKVMIFHADTLEAEYKCGVGPSEIRVLD